MGNFKRCSGAISSVVLGTLQVPFASMLQALFGRCSGAVQGTPQPPFRRHWRRLLKRHFQACSRHNCSATGGAFGGAICSILQTPLEASFAVTFRPRLQRRSGAAGGAALFWRRYRAAAGALVRWAAGAPQGHWCAGLLVRHWAAGVLVRHWCSTVGFPEINK